MPTKVKIRKGQKLVLLARRRRGKPASAAPGEIVRKKRKGVILPPEAESVYRPRRQKGDVVVYDLGLRKNPANGQYEELPIKHECEYYLTQNFQLPPFWYYAFRPPPESFWTQLENQIVTLPQGQKFEDVYKKFEFDNSDEYLADIGFYQSADAPDWKYYALARPNSRRAVWNPSQMVNTAQWKQQGLVKITKRRNLAVFSGGFFCSFDTASPLYKVTSVFDYNADAISVDFTRGSLKLFLMPLVLDFLIFQSGFYSVPPSSAVEGSQTGVIEYRMLPRSLKGDLTLLQSSNNPGIYFVSLKNEEGSINRLTTVVRDFSRQLAYREKSQLSNPSESAQIHPIAGWNSRKPDLSSGYIVLRFNTRVEDFSIPIEARRIPTQRLVGIIEKGESRYYVWNRRIGGFGGFLPDVTYLPTSAALNRDAIIPY